MLGGRDGALAAGWFIDREGVSKVLPNNATIVLQRGESVRGVECSGGGYGDPLDRDPELVVQDVRGLWVTQQHARDVYGVVVTGTVDEPSWDQSATNALRAERRSALTAPRM